MYRIVHATLNYESPNSGRLLGRLTLQLAYTHHTSLLLNLSHYFPIDELNVSLNIRLFKPKAFSLVIK